MNLADIVSILTKLNLDAFLSTTNDEHFNEIVGAESRRIYALTGFSGNYGYALTTKDPKSNKLFTSYQYIEQAKKELNKHYQLATINRVNELIDFLISSGYKKIGFCSKHMISSTVFKFKERLKKANIKYIDFDYDLSDLIWENKPERKFNEVFDLEKIKLEDFIDPEFIKHFNNFAIDKENGYDLSLNVTGSSYKTKLAKVQKTLNRGDAYMITYLDTIAWLLNLRGSDIQYSPLFFSYLYITKNKVVLFSNADVDKEGVEVRKYEDFYDFIQKRNETVYIDEDTSFYVYKLIKKKKFSSDLSSVIAKKNTVELFGMKNASILDAKSIIRLIVWIKDNIKYGISEKDVEKKLYSFNKENKGYYSFSFPSIIASGKNSSKIFHKPSDDLISENDPLLLDTGSQYYFGTTDSTRTVHFGKPTKEFIDDFTLVLKAIIKSKTIRQRSISGDEIDNKTRLLLNKRGVDYPTSTGHAIGHFSIVHERLPTVNYDKHLLEEGETFTLEPSIFRRDYGVRIEDTVYIKEYNGNFFQSNLTYIPLQMDLIDLKALTEDEINYLNTYNKFVRGYMSEVFKDNKKELEYVMKNTVEIPHNTEEK